MAFPSPSSAHLLPTPSPKRETSNNQQRHLRHWTFEVAISGYPPPSIVIFAFRPSPFVETELNRAKPNDRPKTGLTTDGQDNSDAPKNEVGRGTPGPLFPNL